MRLSLFFCLIISLAAPARGQQLEQVLARLDKLEAENQKLLEEIRELRKELAPKNEPLAEKVEVLEHRAEEVDQAKVQASQRFPLSLTGMALFNAFENGKNGGGSQDPATASLSPGPRNTGASFRQTEIGLRFNGPETFLGGKLTGAVDFDLWGGDATSLNHLIRLRTATVRVDWGDTSISVGQDKPLISPRDPDSLAQVEVSPLTGAGNPWLWQPQVRVEHRFALNQDQGIILQGSLYQTRESFTNLPAVYQTNTEGSRPGWEGRAGYWRNWRNKQRFEIATGFHSSFSKVEGQSVASDAVSLDWLFDATTWWQVTGYFCHGQNLSTIGGGSGISLLPNGTANGMLVGVHQNSGWMQSSFRLNPRWKINLMAGDQAGRREDLLSGSVLNNLAWGGNVMYRMAPNVIASFEALQLRTNYLNIGTRINEHYDLALAYLF